jgi:lipopolysaccharide export system protein LptA
MRHRLWLWAIIVTMTAPLPAAAQGPRPSGSAPMPGLVQGNENHDQPVQIEAATLEVRDKAKMATFSGHVQVVQGDTTMKCQTLVVFYGPDPGGSPPKPAATTTATTPGMPQGAQNIRRIEARGGVTVVTKDQNASGDLGVYDLKTKTITLSGNVVVSQGQNVMHGDRVVVDMVTGNARVESGEPGTKTAQGRVRALILPNKGGGQNGGPSNFMTVGPSKTN